MRRVGRATSTPRGWQPNGRLLCPLTQGSAPTVAAAAQADLKGAQTRSCSVSVLMEETAEQVASMHSALLLLANDRQPAGLIWRL
jgi:hypothetical protein